ncbi:hypothetical protein EJB05_55940, partial [Eragrostis curvula]
MPLEPTPETQSLHPSRDGVDDDELLLVQVTRFKCGSYVVGYTLHHLVAGGSAMATSMAAFGQATRGVAVEEQGVVQAAWNGKSVQRLWRRGGGTQGAFQPGVPLRDEVDSVAAGGRAAVQRAAVRGGAPVAVHHRGAPARRRVVNGREPPPVVPQDSGAVEQEGLVLTADAAKMGLSPDVEVYSLLGFPFGSGAPFFHMRGYVAEVGLVFLVPSISGDGRVYAYVNMFRPDMDVFKDCCSSLMAAAADRLTTLAVL